MNLYRELHIENHKIRPPYLSNSYKYRNHNAEMYNDVYSVNHLFPCVATAEVVTSTSYVACARLLKLKSILLMQHELILFHVSFKHMICIS